MEASPQRIVLKKSVLSLLEDKGWLERQLARGKEIRSFLDIDDDMVGHLYRCAHDLFKQHRFEEALYAFLFIVFLDKQHYECWLGLGMSLQLNHLYEAAIDAYEMAAICEIENPVPYFYLAKCLFAIHDHDTALEALDMAITYAEGHDSYQELLQQACEARRSLLRRRDN
jgi:type III secretion system low calcium response chaperone LcrH/SycD